jgi:hypothetical protein
MVSVSATDFPMFFSRQNEFFVNVFHCSMLIDLHKRRCFGRRTTLPWGNSAT